MDYSRKFYYRICRDFLLFLLWVLLNEISVLFNISGNKIVFNICFIFEFIFRIKVNFNLDIYMYCFILLYVIKEKVKVV